MDEARRLRLEQRLDELREKYYDLVWYARSSSMEPAVAARRGEVRRKYPKECEALSGQSSQWNHGFNSGMLAASNLIWAYVLAPESDEVDYVAHAENTFPELDT